MPNWCSNTVVFTGSKAKLGKLKRFFLQMSKKEIKESQGQLPEFLQESTGFMFDISWEDGILYYMTKWGPNTDVMLAVAEHFIVDYTHEYNEPDMQIFGECTFIKGVLTNTSLDQEDYKLIELLEDKDIWKFEGKVYEVLEEILEILLWRKKENQLSE